MTDNRSTSEAMNSVDTFSKLEKSGKEKSIVAGTREDDTDDAFFEE